MLKVLSIHLAAIPFALHLISGDSESRHQRLRPRNQSSYSSWKQSWPNFAPCLTILVDHGLPSAISHIITTAPRGHARSPLALPVRDPCPCSSSVRFRGRPLGTGILTPPLHDDFSDHRSTFDQAMGLTQVLRVDRVERPGERGSDHARIDELGNA